MHITIWLPSRGESPFGGGDVQRELCRPLAHLDPRIAAGEGEGSPLHQPEEEAPSPCRRCVCYKFVAMAVFGLIPETALGEKAPLSSLQQSWKLTERRGRTSCSVSFVCFVFFALLCFLCLLCFAWQRLLLVRAQALFLPKYWSCWGCRPLRLGVSTTLSKSHRDIYK